MPGRTEPLIAPHSQDLLRSMAYGRHYGHHLRVFMHGVMRDRMIGGPPLRRRESLRALRDAARMAVLYAQQLGDITLCVARARDLPESADPWLNRLGLFRCSCGGLHGVDSSVCDTCAALTVCDYCGSRYNPEYGPCCEADEEDGRDMNDPRHGHDYRPSPTFYGVVRDKLRQIEPGKRLFLGVELEMERKTYGDEYTSMKNAIEAITSYAPGYAKTDGSLDDGLGMEYVSEPLTFDAWTRDRNRVTEIFTNLVKDEWRSAKARASCGLHIHTSRAAWTTLRISKMLNLIYRNRHFTLRLSGRSEASLNRWATLDDTPLDQLVRKATHRHGDRYCAVNMEPHHTIEFRLFRGSLKPSTFFRCVEFVAALHAWTGVVSITDSSSVPNFKRFVYKNRKQYPDLAAWLKSDPIHSKREENEAACV